jgi:hypothetical protein
MKMKAVNHKLMIRPEGTLALFRAGRRSDQFSLEVESPVLLETEETSTNFIKIGAQKNPEL